MKRLECLDGLRGVLAVYVLLGHLIPFGTLPHWAQGAALHGGAAVDLFFVLSGLVISRSLDRPNSGAAAFLIARAARIFPVYLPVFALAVLIAPFSCGFERMPWLAPDSSARLICSDGWPPHAVADIVAHVTMTHGLIPLAVLPNSWISFLGAAWSLSVEWQFYLLAVLIRNRRLLVWLLLGGAAADAAWRLGGPAAWQFSRGFLFNHGHFFALGIASLPVVRGHRGARRRLGVVLAAVLLICAGSGVAGKVLPPLAWMAFLAAQAGRRGAPFRALRGVLRHPACLYLGAISYPLYLVNESIQKLAGGVLSRLAGGNGGLFTLGWLPAAIGLPVVVAALLHRWLEAPAMRWGRDAAAGFRRPLFVPAPPSPSVTPS